VAAGFEYAPHVAERGGLSVTLRRPNPIVTAVDIEICERQLLGVGQHAGHMPTMPASEHAGRVPHRDRPR